MRTKDSELMRDIVTAVDEFFCRAGRAPSTRELAAVLPFSHNTVARYLRDMADRGMLKYSDGKIVTDKMSKSKTEAVSIPIVGSVSCGGPLLSEENIEAYVRVPTELVGSGEYYFLRANGDSMKGAGIDDGDLVLVRRTREASDGQIVVALVDNENTLKRLVRDEKRKKIVLHPENDGYADIVVDSCEVQGVAVKVIKDV